MLLIGGTGVGKSMLINAFGNYCSFKTLSEAEKAGGKFSISSNFEIFDPQTGELVRISTEPSSPIPITASTDVGQSVTRKPSEYVINYENTEICIIDTPGLLDVDPQARGTSTHDRDNKNLNNIFRLLWSYNEIHAICVVMMANQNKLSDTFQYILNEIMRRLNTSANNNVIFIFTHAASVHFQPAAIQAILQKYLTEQNLKIPLRRDLDPDKESDGKGNATIYCLENDSVQYLAERKNNIPLPYGFHKFLADTNWSRSQKSVDKMIRYVCGLCPLPLADIKAIYDVHYITGILSELVLETLKCDAKNISTFEDKVKEAKMMKTEVTNNPLAIVKFQPRVQTERVVRTALKRWNVVCEGRRCVTFVEGEAVYTKICCEGCWSPFVYFCASIDILGTCKKCGCDRNEHQWRKTKSEIVIDTCTLGDQAATTVDSNSAKKILGDAIKKCNKRLKVYGEEREQMLRTCAILNTYMKENVLIQSFAVDEMKRKLEYRIQIYQDAADLQPGVNRGLTKLQDILSQYNECLQKESNTKITAADVRPRIEELCTKLPLNGDALREAMEAEESARLQSQQETRDQTY